MFGFRYAPGAWSLHEGWHLFWAATFDLDQVIAVANEKEDGCVVEKVEWIDKDTKKFKVYLKGINRKQIKEHRDYKFYLIYSTKEGKIFKQIIQYKGETQAGVPVELILNIH